MTNRQLIPALIVPFIAWRVYQRVKRNIGRQLFHPNRLKVSIAIFSTVIVIFVVAGLSHPLTLAALAGGLLLSVGIAWYGLSLTKFENTPQGKFYTPNTALGIAISTLFVGRILYRMLTVAGTTGDPSAPPMPPPFQSPLTFFLFGLTAGYYIAYAIGVLRRSHRSV